MQHADPFRVLTSWFRLAVRRSPGSWFDPSAITLATSSKSGHVTARMVLLKDFGPAGFTFYTNYGSRKGRQLSENPRAALVLHWPFLRRQVRIEGIVERVSRDDSEKYFHSRPRLYQLAAAASNQSEKIASRQILIDRFKELRKACATGKVPLPRNWGGYRLIPDSIEFWIHRENRLHDRLRYRREKRKGWTVERLAP